jgi:hypothetical protein
MQNAYNQTGAPITKFSPETTQMNRMLLQRQPTNTDVDALLNGLTTQQFINPQQPLNEALGVAREKIGFCPLAAETALQWLQMDGRQAIGRLRRTELMQLARCIERFWRQATAGGAAEAT